MLVADTPWTFRIPRTGAMRVDAVLFADARLRPQIEEDKTLEQLANVACLPGIVGEALAMPDAHQGYGFPIGGVAAMEPEHGVVSPGGIGYDINCGVRLLASDLEEGDIRPQLKRLVEALFRAVPCGAGRDGPMPLDAAELDAVLAEGARRLVGHGLGVPADLEHCEAAGCIEGADAAMVTHAAKRRGRNQLGTLGSGNHFLEVQRVAEIHDADAAGVMGLRAGQVVVLLHCGSRGLGHQTCADYLETMADAMQRYHIVVPDRELACAPIRSPEGGAYLRAMRGAANFAFANRQLITVGVRRVFGELFGTPELRVVYDVCHNVAKVEDHDVRGARRTVLVHRKGATRAFPAGHPEVPVAYRATGQPVIIPGSMGTCSFVLVGRPDAMRLTFGSTCHGAGRRMSRTRARRSATFVQLLAALHARGIEVRGASRMGMLEEIPEAYKDVRDVVDVVHRAGISTRVATLEPLGVIKG